jgi:transcriptional regulator with XRE-family HTH domain
VGEVDSSRLLEWCSANDITLTDIAGLSGYSVAYLSLISRGKRVPPPRVKITIARALHARVGDLFPPEREEQSA